MPFHTRLEKPLWGSSVSRVIFTCLDVILHIPKRASDGSKSVKEMFEIAKSSQITFAALSFSVTDLLLRTDSKFKASKIC